MRWHDLNLIRISVWTLLCRAFGAHDSNSTTSRPYGRAYSLPALRASLNSDVALSANKSGRRSRSAVSSMRRLGRILRSMLMKFRREAPAVNSPARQRGVGEKLEMRPGGPAHFPGLMSMRTEMRIRCRASCRTPKRPAGAS